MDEMNQFEKQLQSWTPRRPSSRVARRLFGIPSETQGPSRRLAGWNWLAPLAAGALTMLVAVHTASLTARMSAPNNSGVLSSFMLNAANPSNLATLSLNQLDENIEWNVWHHASHRLASNPRERLNIFNIIPTNR